jgi:hypothetical protein
MGSLFGGGGQLTPSSLIAIGVLAVVLVVRNLRPRRLRIERLWLWPAIYVILLGSALFDTQLELNLLNIALLTAAVAIGGAIGWQRARFTEIRVHPETHELSSRASPIGVLFIFAILVLRIAARDWLASNPSTLHIPVVAIGTALLVMVIATLIAQRLEIWRRASRMLAEARAATAAGLPPPPESLVG